MCLTLSDCWQVLNGQRKYQIRLKSSAGPIEVLLVNKDPSSPSPVVLPVPPPEDMLQSLPVPASAANPKPAPAAPSQPNQPLTPSSNPSSATLSPACTATTNQAVTTAVSSKNTSTLTVSTPTTNTTAQPTPLLDTQPLQSSASLDVFSSSSLAVFEPIKTDPSELLDFPKELSDMFDPTKEIMSADLLEELISSEVFSPLLRLSPPPGDHDYIYNLDETEGLCDLFDVPILNL
ncbi:unnamed protein product [Coregonus sp. 'balchen']|nr:unnamed protein product [Coregonus sp. 'balchen']